MSTGCLGALQCRCSPTLVAACGLCEEGKALIQRRLEGMPCGGLREFPGNKIEPSETPEEALRRETEEEIGIAMHRADPVSQPSRASPLRLHGLDGGLRGERRAHDKMGPSVSSREPRDAASGREIGFDFARIHDGHVMARPAKRYARLSGVGCKMELLHLIILPLPHQGLKRYATQRRLHPRTSPSVRRLCC